MRAKDTNETQSNVIPDDALEALARCMYPVMISFFESDEGKREFAEWQACKSIESLSGRDMESDEIIRLAG